jgi:hypothetical protein
MNPDTYNHAYAQLASTEERLILSQFLKELKARIDYLGERAEQEAPENQIAAALLNVRLDEALFIGELLVKITKESPK